MNVLIAPDKFKGSLTAQEAAEAIRAGLEHGCPGVRCRLLPIADGGEGTSEVLCATLGGVWVTLPCRDPLGRTVEASYALLPDGTAVVTMSAASGLWRLTHAERDPLRASTFGTGQLIADAIQHGARRVLVGVGGSATNDGGVGMAAALGYEFLDQSYQPLDALPVSLARLAHVRRGADCVLLGALEIIALCDVDNPLLGPRGATRVYGPQKGADAASMEILETGLTRLADVVARDLGHDDRNVPGAGAAGGLGYGILSFCGGRLQPGFDTVAEAADLAGAIAACDLVITGEGRLDTQTLAGKGPAGVAALARAAGKPVAGFAGSIPDPAATAALCEWAISLVDADISAETAMRDAATLLRRRAADFAASVLAVFVPPSDRA